MREHRYQALKVKDVVQETADTRTFVFDIPDDLSDVFSYRPGQFCTVRAQIAGEDVLRCYSMSSAPGIDADLAVTVKRVPSGVMSNWLHDHVHAGDTLELMPPSGVFCSADADAPLVGFCGGSGVTPVFSLVKHTLATTNRRVKLLSANRDRASVIFHDDFEGLRKTYGDRFELRHHLDVDGGFLQPETVADFVADAPGAEVFICGPTPFMDLVEGTLATAGTPLGRVAIERFGTVPVVDARELSEQGEPAELADEDENATKTLTLILRRKRHEMEYVAGDTVLDAGRRAGLKPPFSCELGNCASCMAIVREGAATMRANNALDDGEVAEGWVLTCQAFPTGRHVVIEYENL